LSDTNMREVKFNNVDLTAANMNSAFLEDAALTGTTTFGKEGNEKGNANVSHTQLVPPPTTVFSRQVVTWIELNRLTTKITGTMFGPCARYVSRNPDKWQAADHAWTRADNPYHLSCVVADHNGGFARGEFDLYVTQ
jgi:hypothetical protein